MTKYRKHARKHHYVPQFYLARFTSTGEKDGQLWAFDMETGKSWPSNPSGVAFEKDFYRVEDRGTEPDVLEKEFSDLEGRAASAIAEIVETQRIPDGEKFEDLLHLVALMAVRVPQKRRNIAKPMEQVAKHILQMIVQTPEHWQSTIARMQEAGALGDEDVSYEQMKDFVERGLYGVEMHQNWHLTIMLEMAATILELLPLRNWSLIVAGPDAGEFICTDNPVLLTWTEEMPPMFSPGFGIGATEIKVPLTKKLALAARFEGEAGVFAAKPEIVAAVNSQAAILADRFVYSPAESFNCATPDGGICGGQEFLDDLRRRRDSEGASE